MKFCVHCGKELMDDAAICMNCGCPTEEKEESAATSQEEKPKWEAPVNKGKNLIPGHKKIAFIAGGAVAILIIALILFKCFNPYITDFDEISERLDDKSYTVQEYDTSATLKTFKTLMKTAGISVSGLDSAIVASKSDKGTIILFFDSISDAKECYDDVQDEFDDIVEKIGLDDDDCVLFRQGKIIYFGNEKSLKILK